MKSIYNLPNAKKKVKTIPEYELSLKPVVDDWEISNLVVKHITKAKLALKKYVMIDVSEFAESSLEIITRILRYKGFAIDFLDYTTIIKGRCQQHNISGQVMFVEW